MKALEFKTYSGELEDLDSAKRVVTGYLSKFGNIDHDNDVMEKTAFTKTLAERKNQIYFLNQHDWKQPHGLFKSLEVDEYGLKFESNPLPDTTYSSDALKLYEAGILKEHSIGFSTVVSEWDNATGVRKIKEVKLYEGSNVTLGANSGAVFTGLKSMTKDQIQERERAILKAFRNGTFTDETFTLLEIALKELQLQSYELGRKEALAEPSNDTHEKAAKVAIELLTNFKF